MNANPMEAFGFPRLPDIDEAQMQECRDSGDYGPILFKWYQFVGSVCSFFACLDPNSAALNRIPRIHYAVLIGLLNRCSRLMLANVALSHEGLFGETTSILDRCIFESALKLRWLCAKNDNDSFDRLVLSGLVSEVKLRAEILKNIQERGGDILAIERRMLDSIDNYFNSVPTTEAQVIASPALPDVSSMLKVVGEPQISYLAKQRMGSHSVHGTWPALFRDYLEELDGKFTPRDHDCPTEEVQYLYVMREVLVATRAFADYVIQDDAGRAALVSVLDATWESIERISDEIIVGDTGVV